jgi:hypothetical protein
LLARSQHRIGIGTTIEANADFQPAILPTGKDRRAEIEPRGEDSVLNGGDYGLRRTNLIPVRGGIEELALELITAICRRAAVGQFSLIREAACLRETVPDARTTIENNSASFCMALSLQSASGFFPI